MSPSLQTTQIEKDVAELDLTPAVKEHLTGLLSTWAELKFDCDALEHQMEIEKMAIGHILESAGIDKAKRDEFSMCWVRGKTTKKLDVKKLIAQGVTLAMIEAATTEKPKKDYFQIRGKNDKSHEESAD